MSEMIVWNEHSRPIPVPHRQVRRGPRLRASLSATVSLLCLFSVGGCGLPDAGFVRAERAMFEAIAPEYRGYVAADGDLSDEQKARRLRTLETWDLSIRQQETRRVP